MKRSAPFSPYWTKQLGQKDTTCGPSGVQSKQWHRMTHSEPLPQNNVTAVVTGVSLMLYGRLLIDILTNLESAAQLVAFNMPPDDLATSKPQTLANRFEVFA